MNRQLITMMMAMAALVVLIACGGGRGGGLTEAELVGTWDGYDAMSDGQASPIPGIQLTLRPNGVASMPGMVAQYGVGQWASYKIIDNKTVEIVGTRYEVRRANNTITLFEPGMQVEYRKRGR